MVTDRSVAPLAFATKGARLGMTTANAWSSAQDRRWCAFRRWMDPSAFTKRGSSNQYAPKVAELLPRPFPRQWQPDFPFRYLQKPGTIQAPHPGAPPRKRPSGFGLLFL